MKSIITEPNEDFKKWVSDNGERIAQASTLPYRYKDNKQYIKSALKSDARFANGRVERLVSEYNGIKPKHVNAPLAGTLTADISGGVATYASKGFTALINQYYQAKANKERVAVLKQIIEQENFTRLEYHSTAKNSIYGINMGAFDKKLTEAEMPKNLTIAKKLLLNGYDVYLLSNPNTTRSADFIISKKGKLFYIEGKTLNGKNSLDHLLQKGAAQSERIVVDVVGTDDVRYIREMLTKAFEQSDVKEIMLLKGSRAIKIDNRIVSSKSFDTDFIKLWNKSK